MRILNPLSTNPTKWSNTLKQFVDCCMNQQCMAQPTFINLHPNEYIQGLFYYPFAVNLDRFLGSSSTLNDLSNEVCVRNKTKDLNLRVFNIARGINESKTLAKHISCEFKCKFDDRKCNSNKKCNNDKYRCEET